MDLNELLEKVAYVSHRERMETYDALTEAERIPLRIEVEQALAREGDADNEFADDMRKLRIAIRGHGPTIRPNYSKLRPDVAETAFRVMQEATGQKPKTKAPSERPKAEQSPDATSRGAKGGTARAKGMSAERRKAIAKKAAAKRWSKPETE